MWKAPGAYNHFLIFPQGGALQRVGAGLQPSGVVSLQVFASHGTNGHLVQVAQVEAELDRRGAAAGHCCVVPNTPVLPLGVWTSTSHTIADDNRTCVKTDIFSV